MFLIRLETRASRKRIEKVFNLDQLVHVEENKDEFILTFSNNVQGYADKEKWNEFVKINPINLLKDAPQ